MENPLNYKLEDSYSTIFSQMRDPKKNRRYSLLQDNLAELQQNVSLLKFYATKGKLNSKNKKNKISSTPKTIPTEIPFRNKTNRKFTRKSDLALKDKSSDSKSKSKSKSKKKIKNLKLTEQSEKTNTQFNDSKFNKSNIFMTKVQYKNRNKNYDNSLITNTSYKNNTTFSKTKNDTLPLLEKNSFNSNLSKDLSLYKSSKKSTNSNSKNKSSNYNKTESLNIEEYPQFTEFMIKNLKRENNDIKNKIFRGKEKFNIMEWYMRTRFKYAQYKYGIAEIEKYFMDLKAFGKPEEEEIEKRKTFFEHVEDVIDEIHILQQRKELEKLNKKYGVSQDKKKIVKSKKEKKEFRDSQKNHMVELSKALQEIDKRRKKEKHRREQIDDILLKCQQRLHSINSFENKLPKKEIELEKI